MFEWIERLFASLIVLVMLFILLLVAFPDRLEKIFGTTPDDNRAEQQQQKDGDLKGPTALPKGDVKPQKTVERLPDSSDNQKALYRYKKYREKPSSRYERAERRRAPVITRPVAYRKLERPDYYSRRYEREPRYLSAREEDCSSGSCLCNCRKPYWASGDWDDDAECW